MRIRECVISNHGISCIDMKFAIILKNIKIGCRLLSEIIIINLMNHFIQQIKLSTIDMDDICNLIE